MKWKSIFVLTTGFIEQPLRKFIDTCIDESEKNQECQKLLREDTAWSETKHNISIFVLW